MRGGRRAGLTALSESEKPAMPTFRTLSHGLGRALHRRRHRARPRLPGVFHAIGAAEIAQVNLPVAVLIWLMIVPMLLKIDFAALGRSASTGAASA